MNSNRRSLTAESALRGRRAFNAVKSNLNCQLHKFFQSIESNASAVLFDPQFLFDSLYDRQQFLMLSHRFMAYRR